VGRMTDDPNVPDRVFKILDRCIETSISHVKNEVDPQRTAWIISSTKGYIAALDRGQPEQAALTTLADHVQRTWKTAAIPWVVSNACASGTSAIALGGQLIRAGQTDHVIVMGIDLLSRFVLDGFRSLYALSAGPCRPFDATRDGTSLGEACAVVVLSNDPSRFEKPLGTLLGSGIAHDANHISGPSRTGEGLMRAAQSAMRMSGVTTNDISVINAHATGTAYNDAMESIAFDRCGLSHVPLSGYKGWFGHTLGAAGILETIIALHALQQGWALRNEGHQVIDPELRVRVLDRNEPVAGDVLLKTSSGFGGCNAALILRAWRN
jgi:3-oxoacyl-[acyl-carrier-protein] synthase I